MSHSNPSNCMRKKSDQDGEVSTAPVVALDGGGSVWATGGTDTPLALAGDGRYCHSLAKYRCQFLYVLLCPTQRPSALVTQSDRCEDGACQGSITWIFTKIVKGMDF